jgi:hypothetical protein
MRPVSASRDKSLKFCPRVEAWRMQGVKEPQGAAAKKGTRLHEISEDYLNAGKQPDPRDEIALRFLPGLRFLPPPGSGGVEADYRATIGGIPYHLVIDYHGAAAALPNPTDNADLNEAYDLGCCAVIVL